MDDVWENMSAEKRISQALDSLPVNHGMTSSFGIQASVLLHLVTSQAPKIPVFFIDTGYLFPETYRYVDMLTELLDLNLVVCRSVISSSWQEVRYGERWNQGVAGIDAYNRENKVEPLEREFRNKSILTWFTGLRRVQGPSRASIPVAEKTSDRRYKINPIADWTDREVFYYQKRYNLPEHPLAKEGYSSVGDVHTTTLDSRFHGLKRECGLHDLPEGI